MTIEALLETHRLDEGVSMSTVCSFSTRPSSFTVQGRVLSMLASMCLLVLNS